MGLAQPSMSSGLQSFKVLETTHPCTTSVTYFSDCSQMEQIQFFHPEYSIYLQYVLKRSAGMYGIAYTYRLQQWIKVLLMLRCAISDVDLTEFLVLTHDT